MAQPRSGDKASLVPSRNQVCGGQFERERFKGRSHAGAVDHRAHQPARALRRVRVKSRCCIGARPRHATRATMLAMAATAGWQIQLGGSQSCWSQVAPEHHHQNEVGKESPHSAPDATTSHRGTTYGHSVGLRAGRQSSAGLLSLKSWKQQGPTLLACLAS